MTASTSSPTSHAASDLPRTDSISATDPAGEDQRLFQLEEDLEAARATIDGLQAQLDEANRAAAQRAAAAAATAADRPAEDQAEVRAQAAALRAELVELNDAVMLQQVGIYEYHHPLENAAAYKDRLSDLRSRIKEIVRDKKAVDASERFAYNNSLAQGRKMTADLSKLMLRAYNAEADNCVRSLRAGSIAAALKRLDATRDAVAKLGAMMEMQITDTYHQLRVEELELTSDWLFKVQEEREAAREERARLREERRAEAELAAERERLERERTHYENALAAVRAGGDPQETAELEARLQAIGQAIETNDYRVANIRAGYVYVISNLGAFGSSIVKIGMTRRLEPMDRVRELGDASVPFTFDVHAIYFSDDAVTLENELHHAFADRRVNQVNLRREFFFATPAEVREVLAEKVGNLLEFTEAPDAVEYNQSRGLWPSAADPNVARMQLASSDSQ